MTQLARIEGSDGLTEQQQRFFTALLEGASIEEAKKIAAYSDGTVTQSITTGPLIEKIVQKVCDARLRGDLRLKALETVEYLMLNGPAATKLNAAKLVLDYGQESDPAEDKPLSDMTIEELEGVIRRREAELKSVTPSNGA